MSDDVTQRGVWTNHASSRTGDIDDMGHDTPQGHVNGILPERYEDCDRHGCKPVVVLDPEDAAQIERLVGLLAEQGWIPSQGHGVRDALRAMLTPPEPPRPDEPGLWGVVSASIDDVQQPSPWVHTDHAEWPWRITEGGAVADWDDLRHPVVIRAGIDDEPAPDPAMPPDLIDKDGDAWRWIEESGGYCWWMGHDWARLPGGCTGRTLEAVRKIHGPIREVPHGTAPTGTNQ